MQPVRKAIVYGDVKLSVQASAMHYSTPRIDGLPLKEYTEVEVALIDAHGNFLRPSEIGIKGFDTLFESGGAPVAGYVPRNKLRALRLALRRRAV